MRCRHKSHVGLTCKARLDRSPIGAERLSEQGLPSISAGHQLEQSWPALRAARIRDGLRAYSGRLIELRDNAESHVGDAG